METLRHLDTIKNLLQEMYEGILNKCKEENKLIVPQRQHILVDMEDIDDEGFSSLYVIGVQADNEGKGLQLIVSPTIHDIKNNRIWWRAIDFDVLWGDKIFRRYISDFLILAENIERGYELLERYD